VSPRQIALGQKSFEASEIGKADAPSIRSRSLWTRLTTRNEQAMDSLNISGVKFDLGKLRLKEDSRPLCRLRRGACHLLDSHNVVGPPFLHKEGRVTVSVM
jgi:hypothetical protein